MDKSFEELSKLKLKQVDLNDEYNRKVYLYKIITIVAQRLDKLEHYITKIGDPLSTLETVTNMEANKYFELIEHHHCYLLNVLGDLQDTSISYLKYRNFCKKKNYSCIELNEDEENILSQLNRERNFCNHIPESILTEDIYKIKNDPNLYNKQDAIFNNVYVVNYEYIDRSYFIAKHESIKRFYFVVKHILSCIIKDLELLCNNKVQIIPLVNNKHVVEDEKFVQKAAKNVQKIDYTIPDDWIDYEN